MNVTLEMFTAGDPEDILDRVTFDADRIDYLTGDAKDLVEIRLRQLPSKADVVAALDGWSNGYVAVRRVAREVVAAAADPVAHELQHQWEQAKADLLARWPGTAAPMVDELADQAEAALVAGDLAGLGDLHASAGVLTALAAPLNASGTRLAREAADGVVAEAASVGANITAPQDAGAETVRQHADAVARLIAAGYASGATKVGLQLAGADPRDVRDAVAEHLEQLGTSESGLVGENIGALLSAAQFAGRLAVLEAHPANRYVAVESNDRARCPRCADVDGKAYPNLRRALADYPGSGRYRACEGRSRCRGFIRPEW